MERTKNTRANPAFQLVKSSVTDLHLPVQEPDYINCWENVELALLKLEDAQFDIIYKDRVSELRERELENMSEGQKEKAIERNVAKKKLDSLPEGVLDDPFIREMEKSLAQGDENSVKEMLKSFKM